MMGILNIKRPALFVDKQKCLNNIRKMSAKARKHGLIFRPHFKTHQSAEVGEWFRKEGIECITVSSVQMATYFAGQGWNNITIAFPVNWLEIDEINQLAGHIRLNLLVESISTLDFLSKKLLARAGFFVKIDTGYHRTGLPAENFQLIDSLLQKAKSIEHLKFKGFLAHSGHTYNASGPKEIQHIHHNAITRLRRLKERFAYDYGEIVLSIGDTPACSQLDHFDGMDEIRPGNFVFYDLMQYHLGSCKLENIAVCMACPVVARHESRHEVVVYGGAIHLSKESLLINQQKTFGLVVELKPDGWNIPKDPLGYVRSLSQEHGILKLNTDFYRKIKPGDLVGIIPVHSCLTVSAMQHYYTFDGKKITTLGI